MQTKRQNYWTVQPDVWIPYFCWSNRETTRTGQTSRKNFSVVLRHGRTCSKKRGTVLRIGKQKDGTTFTITKSQRKKVENKYELSEVCFHIILSCLYLARIGRLDILWSVNKLARNQACDRLARLISYTHDTSDFRQHWQCGQCGSTLSIRVISSFRLWRRSWRLIFGSRTFVPISWRCKKQTSVSHSSTESEIISLDSGLRMDGDSWDLVI